MEKLENIGEKENKVAYNCKHDKYCVCDRNKEKCNDPKIYCGVRHFYNKYPNWEEMFL
jgi:hypothetical protein